MWKLSRDIPLALMATVTLSSCRTTPWEAASPKESAQAVRDSVKAAYMDVSAVSPHSVAQQKLLLKMAQESTNGAELLLTLRAAVGVFPQGPNAGMQGTERQFRAIIGDKLIKVGTLDQLIECVMRYQINQADGQPFIERMFRLADQVHDARVWDRIRLAALHLNASDMAQQAQLRIDLLSGKQETSQ